MNKIKVTISVAVYNVDKYIRKCIESCLNQTLEHNYEILIINDGSNDNSLSIIEEYKDDKKIRILTQENSGLTSVRNRAIKEARGEYLIFLDGDDYLENNMLEVLLNKITQEKSDMVICNFYWEYKNRKIEDERFLENKICSGIEALKLLLLNKINTGVCNKIFKIDILRKNRINFLEIRCAEDYTVILDYILCCEKINILKIPLCNYVQREDGLSKEKNEDFIINNLKVLKIYLQKLWKNKDLREELVGYIVEKFVYICRDYGKIKQKLKIREYREEKEIIESILGIKNIIFNKSLKFKMKKRFLIIRYIKK